MMTHILPSAGLVLAALLAGFSTGCSAGIELDPPAPEQEAELPPLFAFLTPQEHLTLTAVDDVDPDTHGVQLDVLIQVNDLENNIALESVQLWVNNQTVYEAEVKDGLHGRTAHFRGIPVAPNAHHQVLLVVDEGGERLLRSHIRVPMQGGADTGCSRNVTIDGDLVLDGQSALPFAADTDCVTITGDLVVSETPLQDFFVLSSLVSLGGDLVIENNASLQSLIGLYDLEHIGGDLRVVQNPLLPADEAETLATQAGVAGDVIITGNGD